MSSNTTTNLVRYVVYMPHGPEAQVYPFRVPEDADVEELRAQIRGYPDLTHRLEQEELILLKCGDLAIDPIDKRYVEALEWLRMHAQSRKLEPAYLLEDEFPDGPRPRKDKMIDVIAVTESILEAPDVIYALPDIHASSIAKDRLSQRDRMRYFPPPSEGVKSDEKIKGWVNKNSGVHPHRPADNYGPFTALFHPVLAMLRHRLMHLDQVEDPPADHYKRSHKFITICSNGFKKEKLREGELKEIINSLIGEDARWQRPLEGGTATPDAVWGWRRAIGAILELKNLDGIGGNASLQGLLDFAKIICQSQYESYVVRSNCPIILIGIMGRRLEISTAIFTDGIYVDKLLSEEFCVDAWQSKTVLRVGRIFKALALAIGELRDYYETLTDNPNLQPTTAHMYPSPLPRQGYHIPELKYLGKLTHSGELLRKEDAASVEDERPYALYRAKMTAGKSGDDVDVVVKFTVRYHEEAHRILAEKQLAPTLHFCIPLVTDMYMVIMEFVESTPLSLVKEPRDLDKVYTDVKTAIDLLHERDLVFGDLRIPNVMPKPTGGAMLIDFDWVGKHKVDRYPASWNSDVNSWAPEVDRRELMDKAHDSFMLRKLKGILGT